MGIAERREREKEQRRNMILDAAEKLYFSKGVEVTTMDDVAAEAELSKGTLYLYFKNKDDINFGINFRGLEILKSLFIQAVESTELGIEKVRAIGEAYFRFALEHSDYFRMMMLMNPKNINFEEPESHGVKCHECAEEVMGVVSGAVQAGIDDKSIRPDLDPMKTAYTLWGQSTGIIQIITMQGEHLAEHHHIDSQEFLAYGFEMIHHSLLPK